ncbi:phytoene desaturase family protein [Nocardioides massiliensis]|uniref:Pyridine nucleotide-disulfide oxidoreductase domain-containing protein 2 n=1 Tax=Nocardioides massiliensis TaxID=1325935 RepID=A0ABT9NKT1_9ACTN|nr:NAD(P)/FAD-dependent oxidoreductase [Nocardioides massiliensis]MDP9821032.1 phytoene dehydrogenase-like protein [Nocardioides massiliensis]
MTTTYDAVVVGAGPNGLVAANHLLDRGWSVLVLEAQPDVGGAVRSDREVHPDYVHDTFSAFYPLAAGSPTIQSFRLEEHGLRWRHAPGVLGHPLPDGQWAMLHRDRDVTASLMDAQHPGDGDAWLELCATWDRIGDTLIAALLTPFPPVRPGISALTKLRSVGGLQFVKDLLTPVADFGRLRFGGAAPRLLLAGNAGHADIPLGSPGSGLMGILLTMLGQTVGYPVPEGGAGMLTQAMASRVRSLGGEIRCNAEVARIEVAGGRAVGVRTTDGERYAVRHAVVADVTAPQLYGGLVPAEDLPARTLRAMGSFEMDPGTVKVDWALDGPVPWQVEPPYAPGTFHVADSVEEAADALHHVNARTIPPQPFMLAGQMTTSDPTRSPAGTESLWAYTHVPQQVDRDLGDDPVTGRWDSDECERFADRMQARIERLAPGFGSRVVARRVLGPREMEARNANLIGGGLNGGTSQLHQQLVFRPVPGWGRTESPIAGLYLGSASAHPGGGVHGACGMNAARAAVAHRRVRRLVPGR